MPASKAQQKAVNKYMKNNYDRLNINVPKGQKEVIQERASAVGQSINSYVVQAVDERIERDKEGIQ